MTNNSDFHKELKTLMNQYVHLVYDYSSKFPKEELYGVTSQFRRAALSVVLNYIEGYARQRKAHLKNFLEIAYGSLKECKYLCHFTYEREYISKDEFEKLIRIADRIGAMLWGILKKL